jgi:hypothetical protein
LLWVFGVEIFTCPNCGGARRLLAAIKDPDSIERVLRAMNARYRAAAIRGAGVGGGAGAAGWWGWLVWGVIGARDGGSGGGCPVAVGERSAKGVGFRAK